MNLMGRRKLWYIISGIIIGIGLIFLVVNGLNFGIDFQGGTILEYRFDEAVTNAEVREIVTEDDLLIDPQIQQSAEGGIEGVIIRTRELDTEEIMAVDEALENAIPSTERLRSEVVGPLIGQELRTQALWALLIASIAIVLYISFRFEFRFAIVAIITLLHDVLITLGIFAIVGYEINTPFVAALLTIIGYSVNDTIVIFDRIRENMKIMRRAPFIEKANTAVIDTLPRSINTSLTTLVAILAIFFFGGAAIRVFMFALFVGMLAGTYSSIFVASPLLVTWDKRISAS